MKIRPCPICGNRTVVLRSSEDHYMYRVQCSQKGNGCCEFEGPIADDDEIGETPTKDDIHVDVNKRHHLLRKLAVDKWNRLGTGKCMEKPMKARTACGDW